MNTNVRVSDGALDPHLRTRRRGKRDLRVSSVHLWRCHADECVRNRVLSGIAAFQMSIPVIIRNRHCVMLMRRQSVVVLWMVVIVVHVGVQRRHHPRRREERRDEQQRQ